MYTNYICSIMRDGLAFVLSQKAPTTLPEFQISLVKYTPIYAFDIASFCYKLD
jgi:hypothetical protein